MISVIILTKNEEQDLPVCLDSLRWCDDVHVLDSGSTDETLEIAYNHGVSVSTHPFESFGKQRNFALDHIHTKYDWILFLDADEKVTEKFRVAIVKAVTEADRTIAGFYCCWKMMLDGKWLRRCDNFPKWQFRLMRKGMARFTDFGHGQKEHDLKGKTMYIKEPYLHYNFSKGWSHWILRQNKYSTQEASARLNGCPPIREIFSQHGSIRNPALRSWLSKVPGWPLIRFCQAYLFNLGFLEGVPGFIYCVNMSYYEFLVQLKMKEIKRKRAKEKSLKNGILLKYHDQQDDQSFISA